MPSLADLLRAAYADGWALSGGPMTGRVRAGCTAAVELGLAHADNPRILEATLRLGHLEGVWATIYERRDQVHADNRAVILALWRPAVTGLDIDDMIRRAERAARGVGEASLGALADRIRNRIISAVGDLLRQIMHTGAWRALRKAITEAIRRGLAEGRVGALGYNADKLGKVGFDWDLAFDDAWKELADTPGLLDAADDWLARAIGDQASVLGRRLSALITDGVSREDLITAAAGLLDEGAPVALIVDQLTGRALIQGALDLYAQAGATAASVITAGDDRVCPQCDGYEVNSPYPLADVPIIPAHPRCRCSVVAEDPFPMP